MHTRRPLFIRETPPAYGPHEADREPYPGATVLEDLATAGPADIGRILARYAAVRCRLVHDVNAPAPQLAHARVAARAYLDAVPADAEGKALQSIASGGGPGAAWEAGGAAARAGHVEGAYAVYRIGYLVARRRRERRWAAALAASISVLLEESGLDGAELWAERSRRLGLAGR